MDFRLFFFLFLSRFLCLPLLYLHCLQSFMHSNIHTHTYAHLHIARHRLSYLQNKRAVLEGYYPTISLYFTFYTNYTLRYISFLSFHLNFSHTNHFFVCVSIFGVFGSSCFASLHFTSIRFTIFLPFCLHQEVAHIV